MQKTDEIKLNEAVKRITIVNPKDLPEGRHTEDLQDIITKVPSWIVRWGITIFFGILLMTVGISVLVRYPDTVKGNLKIESGVGSLPVISALEGRITKVLIKQNQTVKKGDTLACIESLENQDKIYPLIAPQDGKAAFVAIIQPGAYIKTTQEVFVIHPDNEIFFGIMEIPKSSISKIKEGQQVLIKLNNNPNDENGQLKGKISYIADEPGKEGFFMAKVILDNGGSKSPVELKSWMNASAEIITENVSLQSRIYKSIMKGIK